MGNIYRQEPDFVVGNLVVWDKDMGPNNIIDSHLEENIKKFGEGPFTVTDIKQVEGVCNFEHKNGRVSIFCETNTCCHDKKPNYLVYIAEMEKPMGFRWFTKA